MFDWPVFSSGPPTAEFMMITMMCSQNTTFLEKLRPLSFTSFSTKTHKKIMIQFKLSNCHQNFTITGSTTKRSDTSKAP